MVFYIFFCTLGSSNLIYANPSRKYDWGQVIWLRGLFLAIAFVNGIMFYHINCRHHEKIIFVHFSVLSFIFSFCLFAQTLNINEYLISHQVFMSHFVLVDNRLWIQMWVCHLEIKLHPGPQRLSSHSGWLFFHISEKIPRGLWIIMVPSGPFLLILNWLT